MNARRKQIVGWAVKHIKDWPGPLDTSPETESPSAICAEWALDANLSTLPVLRCSLGGCWCVTASDWFYSRKQT